MDIGRTYIKKPALEGIIRSAYETLTVECFGHLFGKFDKKNDLVWIVEYAYPIQIAKRNDKGCCVKSKVIDRAVWSLSNEFIGDYHSHVGNEPLIEMSYTDTKDLRKRYKDKIGLIVAFKKQDKTKKIEKLRKNPLLISGYIKDNGSIYRVDIGGFYFKRKVRQSFMETSKKALMMIS